MKGPCLAFSSLSTVYCYDYIYDMMYWIYISFIYFILYIAIYLLWLYKITFILTFHTFSFMDGIFYLHLLCLIHLSTYYSLFVTRVRLVVIIGYPLYLSSISYLYYLYSLQSSAGITLLLFFFLSILVITLLGVFY